MTTNAPHPDRMLIDKARSSRSAERLLLNRLRPLVMAPVRVCLRRWPARKIAAQDEEDLCAEILLRLFEGDGRALSKWDEARGTLGNYVSWYSRSRLKELERKELRRLELVPATIDIDSVAEPGASHDRPDEISIARQLSQKIRQCLKKKMPGEKAGAMIALMYDRMLSTDEIVKEAAISREQVSRMRYLIKTNAKKCLEEIQEQN